MDTVLRGNDQQQTSTSQQLVVDSNQTVLSDLSAFLIRKQLVPERFSDFHDKAESYYSWKSSFLNIASELNVSKTEELELLVKRLTGRSKEVSVGIRNANPGLASRAFKLDLIWERLEEMFGRPEMIEASLHSQLQNFRAISTSGYGRLHDLLNILIQIESLKANTQYATSLAYYESSTGVNPIVQKLPCNIQDKWVTRAAAFKRTNNVHFPPFATFVEFIKEMCAIRNDPAFAFNKSGDTQRRGGQAQSHRVQTRKADVNENVQTHCPMQKASYSIHECHGFREKPLAECKNFLVSRHICTRCCTSTRHVAKDCKVKIKCGICSSMYHCTALHFYRSPQQRGSPGGGERGQDHAFPQQTVFTLKEEAPKPPSNGTDVAAKCTTLCGDTFKGRSCSKTVLVNIFHSDNPGK